MMNWVIAIFSNSVSFLSGATLVYFWMREQNNGKDKNE